jgi:hypothetical protein
MITPNTMVPPVPVSNEALATALTLLAIAADPQKTKSRLAELTDQLGAVREAHEELVAERASVEVEQAKLADLGAREKAVADQMAAVEQMQTQANVASAALQSRSAELDKREADLVRRSAELAAREQSLAARVQSYRRGLEA